MANPGGRLTCVSNTPVPSSDQLNVSSFYYTPYEHNEITLYNNGTSQWNTITFSQTSISIPGTSNTMYDVFGYLNSGVLAIETVAWTNDTTRATALAYFDGRLVKSGNNTRLYLGSFRTGSTSGRVTDTREKRLIFNNYNRVTRTLRRQDGSATSWSYNSTAWRQANANSDNQVASVFGLDGIAVYLLALQAMTSGAPQAFVGIGKDGINNSGFAGTVPATGYAANGLAILTDLPVAGYHYFPWVERVNDSSFASGLSALNTSNELCGITGTMSM